MYECIMVVLVDIGDIIFNLDNFVFVFFCVFLGIFDFLMCFLIVLNLLGILLSLLSFFWIVFICLLR